MKIQATLDLLQNQWTQFQITPFTCNDQAASPQILPGRRQNDLVIRDLGYLVSDVFRQIHQRGAYLAQGLHLAGLDGGEKIDLLKLLGSRARWDGFVLLGQSNYLVKCAALG